VIDKGHQYCSNKRIEAQIRNHPARGTRRLLLRYLLCLDQVLPNTTLGCINKIDEYVEAFRLGEATKAAPTPMSPDFVQTIKSVTPVSSEQFPSELEHQGVGTDLPPGNRFGELVGSLLYIANQTRPEISTAVGIISQYRAKPTTAQWKEGLRILR
jgi:hypothetical protein